jgi:rhodanese-related sulfurtransferase/catechol 2,3-dioxygenase-like lactoylglutathione lyase family enzyme
MQRLPVDSQITFLTVSDLEASGHFYGTVLGLDLVVDQGSCRIYRVTSSAFLGICTHRDDVRAEGVIVTLVSDQVDRWYDELSANGVEFESAPALNERFGIYHVFLRDPDGHLVEIQQFMDSEWAGQRTADDLLTDARDSGDIGSEGSIPEAIAIPLSLLEWRVDPESPFRLNELVDFDGPLILVCNDGFSSSLAAARLRELGRSKVGDLVGGFRAWKLEGLPVA